MNDELEKYIANKMITSIEEEFSNSLFGSFSSTYTNIQPETLTIEKCQEMIYSIFPKLYYATAAYCQRGKIYLCNETEYNPEYIIFHPDDFEEVKKSIKGRTLVHIKNEPKEENLKRLIDKMKKR